MTAPESERQVGDRWLAGIGFVILLLVAVIGGFVTRLFGFATDSCYGGCNDALIGVGLLVGPLGIVAVTLVASVGMVARPRPGQRVAWIPWAGIGGILVVILTSYSFVSAGAAAQN